MKTRAPASALGGCFRKLLLIGGLALLGLYALGVAAGYIWLHHVRHNVRITVADVALLRVAAVRRGIAAEQFVQARKEWDANNYQAAFLNYTSAVRNDPDDIAGRLDAVKFLTAAGATNQAIGLLDDGLARTRSDRRLLTKTFDLLTASGRDAHALELLSGVLSGELDGPNGPMLQSYQLLATLNSAGAPAARKLLDQRPELPNHRPAVPVVARVLWESAERLRAIGLLAKYVNAEPGAYAPYAQLAGWQKEGGLTADAMHTAERACAQFPTEPAPRILLIEAQAASIATQSATLSITAYLRDFSSRPEALLLLAEAAGRNGWLDLARSLYAVGANRQPELTLFALCYGDALARNSRFAEFQQLLAQVEAQAPEKNTALLIQLRQRQVIAAAALNDPDNVREFARRLAAALRSNPEALEQARRNFSKMGITGAVTELAGRPAAKRP